MTIVVSVRVNDGLVLAADSATTFFDNDGKAVKVYNNANKIFNLVKVWPIAAMTYGAGGIGVASIGTLSKDLRQLLDPASHDQQFALDAHNYTVEEVATKAKAFLFDRCFRSAYPGGSPGYFMGYRVCGYSSGATLPEVWEFRIGENDAYGPERVYEDGHFGVRWAGETEALDRLILGVGSRFAEALEQMGVEAEAARETKSEMIGKLYVPLYLPAMPIQDAIDLATFLADTSAKFTQFSLRAATVGGPIEVAAITKHEGFKWVSRKHYFSSEYNVRA
jgi:hypothetical protein